MTQGKLALSPRQQQVLDLLCAGRTHPQIAARLGVSLPAVMALTNAIKTKLGVDMGDRQWLAKLKEGRTE